MISNIHTIFPVLILLEDENGDTPLSWAVAGDSDCDFIKAVYTMEPTAISKV